MENVIILREQEKKGHLGDGQWRPAVGLEFP